MTSGESGQVFTFGLQFVALPDSNGHLSRILSMTPVNGLAPKATFFAYSKSKGTPK